MSFFCRFDYIVRDSRACGLGCNFHFERYVLVNSVQIKSKVVTFANVQPFELGLL